MSNQVTYIHTTFEDAKQKGIKSKAIVFGIQYTGYVYEGYFFYHLKDIGNIKSLIKHCKNVEEVLE